MDTRRRLMVSGTLILAVLTTLALAVGFTLAREPEPEGNIDEASGPAPVLAATPLPGAIPIQGQLTDDNGNPINGYHTITFSLYATSYDTTPVCQDDDDVNVDNGLFTAYMEHCTSSEIDGKQLYLGVQVEGDTEMSPRAGIYPVPYAISLLPGTIIRGSTSNAIVQIENLNTAGRGLRAYAMSETGTNYGMVGASRSPDGYGGYYYNDGGGTGVYGEGSSPTSGVGVEGSSIPGTGVYGYASNGYGIYGETDKADNSYGLYSNDNLYSLNYHSTGAMMQVVQNSGKTSLETGDVVAFSGVGAPLEEDGQPVIQVVGVDAANSTAVAGVVHSRYNIEALRTGPEKVISNVTPEGAVAPGEYLLVVVQGPAQVKASAITGPLQPGDLLSSAGQIGYAAKAAEVAFGDVEVAIPGTILGKVLEPLDEGEALIYIFVTLQ